MWTSPLLSPVVARARTLVDTFDRALAAGTRHYNQAGALLPTTLDILRTLRDEGKVTAVPRRPDDRQGAS